jgi:hypothetical protein
VIKTTKKAGHTRSTSPEACRQRSKSVGPDQGAIKCDQPYV